MPVLKLDNRDGALWVTFNRPDHFNSLDPESMCRIMDILRRCRPEAVDTSFIRCPATGNGVRPPPARHS